MSAEKKLTECLSVHIPRRIWEPSRYQAAVLVPIFEYDNDFHIVYIRRSNRVAFHKGQISFPGGRRDPEDADLKQTALRESWEEIELKADDVHVIGQLDDIKTTTSNFIVTPFVGLIPFPYTFKKCDYEHEEVFHLPVSALVSKAIVREVDTIEDNEPVVNYFYDYDGRTIWGATARVTAQLLELTKSCYGTTGQAAY